MKQGRQTRRATRGEVGQVIPAISQLNDGSEDNRTGALTVLRRGLSVSPELRSGATITVMMALIVAVGSLAIPILIQ